MATDLQHKTKIIRIIQETHDVKTFRLVKPEGFSFIPGQYCMWSLGDKVDAVKKPFTISNIPQDDHLEFTIKIVGDFTKEIDKLKEDEEVLISEAKGKSFNFDKDNKKEIVYIAGGSGITPFIPAIRYIVREKLPHKVMLLFGNKTEDDIIYRDELEDIDKDNENIAIINILSEPKEDDENSWEGETGFIDKDIILKYVKDIMDKRWMICGPVIMNQKVKEILLSLGIPKEDIKT